MEEEAERESDGKWAGEGGNAESVESLLKGDGTAAAGKEVEKICSRTSHLTSSQDDADSNGDRHEADLFGLVP